MIIQKHWEQSEPLTTLDEKFFSDELSPILDEFVNSDRYKEYYSNHVVIEKHKNLARLFNKNTEDYIAIGFFNSDIETPKKIKNLSEIESKLKEMEDALSNFHDFDDYGRGIYNGWIEALKYVLGTEKNDKNG